MTSVCIHDSNATGCLSLPKKTIRYVETKNRAIKREKESGSEGRLQVSQWETVDLRVQKRRGEEAELAVPQFLLKVQQRVRALKFNSTPKRNGLRPAC